MIEGVMPGRRKQTKKAKKPTRSPAKSPKKKELAPGQWFEKLVAVQACLRAPDGCPWDREQTHQSLRTYLLEEAYEVLEALEAGNDAQLAAELGDLLLQVVFHSQLAREAGRFDICDVIEQIQNKLIRRHPHVFGKIRAKTSAQVLKNWEQLKAEERQAERGMAVAKAPASLLDGVPRTLPALLEAHQLTRRASRIGFDWENFEGLLEKLREEAAELREAHRRVGQPQVEEEVGDLLFVAVNMARFLGMDPEVALKKANRKFAARFREMEEQAARSGRRLAGVPRDELEAFWEASKRRKQPAPASSGRAPASSGRR